VYGGKVNSLSRLFTDERPGLLPEINVNEGDAGCKLTCLACAVAEDHSADCADSFSREARFAEPTARGVFAACKGAPQPAQNGVGNTEIWSRHL
jgi:hypothetical protein